MRRGIGLAVALTAGLPAQDFIELPWRVSVSGQLEVDRGAAPTGSVDPIVAEWTPMFAGLLPRDWKGEDPAFGDLPSLGPIAALPLLLHGDGGAAALDEATHRLRKLGVPVTLHTSWMADVRPDPLLDLLRVKRIHESEVYTATNILRKFATDERRDRFVRAAAASLAVARESIPEMREWMVRDVGEALVQRNGAVALHAGLEQLPDDADLVLGLRCAAGPSAAPLLKAWRSLVLGHLSQLSLEVGASLSPAQGIGGQLAMDRPGQLPYELAVRFGNWRVDYALAALRCTKDGDRWWLHLGGTFQPALIANGLNATDARVSHADDIVTADGYGFSLRATATTFEAWEGDLTDVPRGSRLGTLHDRGAPGRPVAWMSAHSGNRFTETVGLDGASLHVEVDLERQILVATAGCADADSATRVREQWAAWQAGAAVDLDAKVDPQYSVTWRDVQDSPVGMNERRKLSLTWRTAIRTVTSRTEGATVEWRWDFSTTKAVDILRWMQPPLSERLQYR